MLEINKVTQEKKHLSNDFNSGCSPRPGPPHPPCSPEEGNCNPTCPGCSPVKP